MTSCHMIKGFGYESFMMAIIIQLIKSPCIVGTINNIYTEICTKIHKEYKIIIKWLKEQVHPKIRLHKFTQKDRRRNLFISFLALKWTKKQELRLLCASLKKFQNHF